MGNRLKYKKICIIGVLVICTLGMYCLESMALSTPTINSIVNNLRLYLQGEKTAQYTIKMDENGSESTMRGNLDFSEGEDISAEVTNSAETINVTITNNADTTQKIEKQISYTITDQKVIFNYEADINHREENSEEVLGALEIYMMELFAWAPMLFLSVTDECGIDSNLAYAYFSIAQSNGSESETEQTSIVENDIFKLQMTTTDQTETSFRLQTVLEINLSNVKPENFVVEGYVTEDENEKEEGVSIQVFNEQFISYEGEQTASQIRQLLNIINSSNESNIEHQVEVNELQEISSTTTYIVTLSYDSEGYVNKVNIVAKEEDKGQQGTNNEDNKVQKDESVSTVKIPNTGKTVIEIIIVATILIIIMLITCIKIKKMKF